MSLMESIARRPAVTGARPGLCTALLLAGCSGQREQRVAVDSTAVRPRGAAGARARRLAPG